jgi:hypothetical protein
MTALPNHRHQSRNECYGNIAVCLVSWLLAGREATNAGCGQAKLSESSYGVAKADKTFPMQLGDLALRVAFVDLAQGIEFVWS